MKKITTIGMVAILFLTAVFAAAQTSAAQAAGGPADVTVTVKNLTGGTVTLRLTDENSTHWFTFEGQGTYSVTVPEGRYSFYASTNCGGESGEFNLNVSKLLNFYCEDGAEVSLTKPEGTASCNVYAWWHWWPIYGETEANGHWHDFEEDMSLYGDGDAYEKRCTDGDPNYGSGT